MMSSYFFDNIKKAIGIPIAFNKELRLDFI